MTTNKVIAWDMDGTLADLYGVDNWLDKLHNEDASPYIEARPLVDVEALTTKLLALKAAGYAVAVVSWLAGGSSKQYDKDVRAAKRAWLEKYFPGVFDEVHLVKYGTTKRQTIRKYAEAILVDDNAKVRKGFSGQTIDASNTQKMMEELSLLVA